MHRLRCRARRIENFSARGDDALSSNTVFEHRGWTARAAFLRFILGLWSVRRTARLGRSRLVAPPVRWRCASVQKHQTPDTEVRAFA